MDLIRAMQVYVAVVEARSLVAAAAKLDTSNAAVSRHVAALEDHLGTRLLNRTTRRLSMTDAGQEFFGRAQQILSDVAEAEAIAGESATSPSGLLRISAPLSFGIITLSKWLPGFIVRHPDLRLDVDLTDRMVDLATEGVDVALRIGQQPATTNVISRRLAPVAMVICASPDYLKRHGCPAVPSDLTHHQTLSYSYLSTGESWNLVDRQGQATSVRINPIVRANNGDVLRELAVQGLAIVLGPAFIVEDDIATGRLVPILEGWSMTGFSLYAIYLSRKFLPAKVRVFINYLEEVSRAQHPRHQGDETG